MENKNASTRMGIKKIAIFDYDNTLFFTDAACKMASNDVLNKKLTRSKIKKLPLDVRVKIFTLASRKYWKMYKVNNSVIERCQSLKLQGYYIIVISTRWNTVKRYTIKSLVKENIPFQKLVLDRKNSRDGEKFKINYLKSLLGKYEKYSFFDDSINIMQKLRKFPSFDKVSLYLVKGTKIMEYKRKNS